MSQWGQSLYEVAFDFFYSKETIQQRRHPIFPKFYDHLFPFFTLPMFLLIQLAKTVTCFLQYKKLIFVAEHHQPLMSDKRCLYILSTLYTFIGIQLLHLPKYLLT